MKKLFSLFSILLIAQATTAQTKFAGNWTGILDVGSVSLHVVFHISQTGDKWEGKMDSPDQGVFGKPCSGVTVKGDSLIVEIKGMGGMYAGMMTDENNINGALQQRGMSMPLPLKKSDKISSVNHPQTPKPPYDYKSEDIIYQNPNKTIQYGATLTTPKGNGPFPAVLLITGSGLQNRDEEVMGHKPFAVIADYLTRQGYVVLRVDDRAMGKSTGDIKTATTADFIKDVTVSWNYLLTRKEVNKKKAGLLGHSEGGYIAEVLAAERKDVDFIVIMAGPGEKIARLIDEQGAAIMESAGIPKSDIEEYKSLHQSLTQIIISSKDSAEARSRITMAVDSWKKLTPPATVTNTTGITDDATEQKFVSEFTGAFTNPWFRYFMSIDPTPYLEKISCKVLALNGDKDIQVVSKNNLQGIRDGLAKSKSKDYEIKELPGLNHLFQQCIKCTVDEYAQIEETIHPEVLALMGKWLNKNVK